MSEALTRSLLLSPLCSEVVAVGQIDRREFESLSVSTKLRQLGATGASEAPREDAASASASGAPLEGLHGVRSAFCVLGGGRWATPPDLERARSFVELCKAASVPHVSLLSCIWADPSSSVQAAKQHGAIDELFVAGNFDRLSIFRPSLVLPGAKAGVPEDAAFPEKAYYAAFPTIRQFLPSQYREVSLEDTVLAMRLNAELCDSAERVERLDFADMMQIIGKEDTV